MTGSYKFARVSEWIGFNVPINTLYVMSETGLSSTDLHLNSNLTISTDRDNTVTKLENQASPQAGHRTIQYV